MVDYKKLYFSLFNVLTDAIEAPDLATTRSILCKAQADAEELYLQEEADEDEVS